jgi:RND superfamily putative drug exporter
VVLFGWIAVLVAGFACWGTVYSRLDRKWSSAPHESVVANQLLADVAPYGSRIDAILDGRRFDDPELAAAVADARADLLRLDGVAAVVDPFTADRLPASAPRALVAFDKRAVLVSVGLERDLPAERQEALLTRVDDRLHAIAAQLTGVRVVIGGDLPTRRAVVEQAAKDMRFGEMVALPLTLVLLCLLFRGMPAAAVPLLAALATIGTGLLALLALSTVRDLDSTQISVTTVVGLGLAIDYSLLQVDRFREERARGKPVPKAVAAAMETAGRTLLFSGLTVATALCGLWVFPSPFYVSIGLAGTAVVLAASLTALTLTPALLGILAKRITARAADSDQGLFARLARVTRRFPVALGLLVAALLAAGALPFLHVRLVNSDPAQLLPAASEARRHSDLLGARFAGCRLDTVMVVARTSPQRLQAWAAEQAVGVERVAPAVAQAGGLAAVAIEPVRSARNQAAADLVTRLRAHRPADFPVWVTGRTALELDFANEVKRYAPRAAVVVGLATFVLLLLMTGSVLVPLKALLMNTLSLGASFGALVLVFQDGLGSDLLGVQTDAGGLQTYIPVVVFAFAFGMSMDYEMFLVARIKELRDAGMANDEAVERGLQRSGRIITSAAALMVVVFVCFAAGTTLAVKQLGLALALAVILDATLVRCVLVPAAMTLLGNLNWWAPAPVQRLRAGLLRLAVHDLPGHR